MPATNNRLRVDVIPYFTFSPQRISHLNYLVRDCYWRDEFAVAVRRLATHEDMLPEIARLFTPASGQMFVAGELRDKSDDYESEGLRILRYLNRSHDVRQAMDRWAARDKQDPYAAFVDREEQETGGVA